MYEFNLPARTQVIGGRQRSGKTTTALALAKMLSVNTTQRVLIITDQQLSISNELEEFGAPSNNVISNEHKIEIDVTKYDSVILIIESICIDIDKMRFESYCKLSPSILSYLNTINEQIQKPFVIVTTHLNKNSIHPVKAKTKYDF